jgi:hypothetical protein
MDRKYLAGIAALMIASQANAHEVWLEQDASGPTRVFLGEPDYPAPPGGDEEFPRLKAPVVFRSDPAKAATLVRRADHLEADVPGTGDIRLRDAAIFDPVRSEDGTYSARIYYARAGRAEARAALDFEIVPQQSGANNFKIMFKGAPASREGVRIIRPDRWLKNIKSDDAGRFTVSTELGGRYLIYVDHDEKTDALQGTMRVSKITHVATLTFVQP